MTMTIEEKARRCGELLALSPLDEEIKKTILKGLDNFTEGDIDRLLFSLESENEHLGLIASQLVSFDAQQNKGWNQVAKDQKKKADDVVNAFASQVEKDIQDEICAEMK